jgi:hypothetical protein
MAEESLVKGIEFPGCLHAKSGQYKAVGNLMSRKTGRKTGSFA